MKKTIVLACILWIATVILPVFLLKEKTDEPGINSDFIEVKETVDDGKNTEIVNAEISIDKNTIITVLINGKAADIALDEYLTGVLAAEMPASFPEEALKAQAVAARSFIMYRIANPPSDGVHDGIAICNNPAHCKAYYDISTAQAANELFGRYSDMYAEKIRKAVSDTDGMILVYGGEPALAAFHAISGGMTENAEDVWGSYVPYLVSVPSPGEEDAVKFTETVEFETNELITTLKNAYPKINLNGDAGSWLSEVVRTEAGSIKTASLGGVSVKGSEIRFLLGLNSADFIITGGESCVYITTTGYGHGVGMSQYGARAMAKDGADFSEILLHYYAGCSIDVIGEQG